jgi:hypothetical protein
MIVREPGALRGIYRVSQAKKVNRHNKPGRLLYGLGDEPVHLGIEEKPEEFGVDFLVANA